MWDQSALVVAQAVITLRTAPPRSVHRGVPVTIYLAGALRRDARGFSVRGSVILAGAPSAVIGPPGRTEGTVVDTAAEQTLAVLAAVTAGGGVVARVGTQGSWTILVVGCCEDSCLERGKDK